MPDAFYKYMSSSTANIVLKNQTLRWTTPATLNDPYDIQFDLNTEFDRDIVCAEALDKIWKVYKGELPCARESRLYDTINLFRKLIPDIPKQHFFDQMRSGILESFAALDRTIASTYETTRKLLSTSKILCLTDSPTNQLMWAYYADSNKGVVLRFIQEPKADSPYTMAKPVSYKKEIPKLFEESELSDFLSGLVGFNSEKRVEDLVFTKSEAWSHEREWRIFCGDGRHKHAPHEDIKFGPKELSAVILGCRMPTEQKIEIALTARKLYPHAEVLQATPANHKYELEIHPFQVSHSI